RLKRQQAGKLGGLAKSSNAKSKPEQKGSYNDKDKTKEYKEKMENHSFSFQEDISRVIEATKKISSFFDLSEMNQPSHFMKIGNFVRHLESIGKIDLLSDQFTAYKAIKSLNPKFRHS